MNYAEVLRGASLKATKGRIAILQAFHGEKPLSVPDILKKLRGKNLDTATVYRALEAFADLGIVRRIDLQHSHAHYELAGEHHHHLICKGCGKIEDVEACDTADFEKGILRKSKAFASISNHSLEFFGLCRKCARP